MLMRSSWLRYLELIFWGMSTVERYQSTDGFSFLPFDRVLPLRHTLPVRLDTPTARAACVKFMPASRCSTYRRRRAAHISPRVAYSTPSNTHLSTWPSHQSARRCDDHWNPPFAIFLGGETGGGKCAMGVGCIVLADDAQVHSFGRWIVSANRGSMEQPSCDCLT